jgi:hypothetical protein
MADSLLRLNEKNSVDFSQSLMDIFKQQFPQQQGMLNFLNGKLQGMIQNPTGFSSQDLSALRTNASTNAATQTQNALKASGATEAARGGGATSAVQSGVDKQIQGQIQAAGAGALSNNLSNIEVANEQQRQNNYWNAIRGESSVAEMENPQSYAGAADSAANTGTNAGTAYFNTQGPGIGSIMGGILGGAAGAVAGPVGSALGSKLGSSLGGSN